MTVATQTPRNQWAGNSSQTTFDYLFEIVQNSDLAVYVDGTRKALNTEYTVTGAGTNAGGTVVFLTAPASGSVVTIARDMPLSRVVDWQAQGSFFSANANADSDRHTMAEQQLNARIDRSIRIGPGHEYQGESMEITETPSERASKVLSFDSDGNLALLDQYGAAKFLGTWNADANTPVLASGQGERGGYYWVSVAGSTNLDGITSWAVRDIASFNGTVWQRLPAEIVAEETLAALNTLNNVQLSTLSERSKVQPTAGGFLPGSRVSKAVVINTGHYAHFPRGCDLGNGSFCIIHYLGDSHGSADSDGVYLLQQPVVSGALTLDGPLISAGTLTLSVPIQLYLWFTTNESSLVLTVSGTVDVAGVPSAPTTRTINGVDRGPVISTDKWWTVTGISINQPATGDMSIGLRNSASGLVYLQSNDGGQTFTNSYSLVDPNGGFQGYQPSIVKTRTGNLVAMYYKNIIGQTAGTTYIRTNTKGGDPSGWGEESLVSFPDAPVGLRPIFYSDIDVQTDGTLITALQSGRYLWWAKSVDEGHTWTFQELATMSRINADTPVITGASSGSKTFTVKGDYSTAIPSGAKLKVIGTGVGNDGVYSVTAVNYTTGYTTWTVSETVASNTAGGFVYVSGIVAVNQGTKTFTLSGESHYTSLSVGHRLCLNSTPGGDHAGNDGLYTVTSLAIVSNNTEVTVAEAIRSSSAGGKAQNAELGETAWARIDDKTFVAIVRLVSGGTSCGEQFVSLDGGATRWLCRGRTNCAYPGMVSSRMKVARIGGRIILNWFYHRRDNTGPNPYSVAYRTADALQAIGDARVWGAEQVIVSSTTSMTLTDGSTVTLSSTYRRHGYPFVWANPTGDSYVVIFAGETANELATLYAVAVRPNYEAYFGGWEYIGSVDLTGVELATWPDYLTGYSSLKIDGNALTTGAGQYALRVSEDNGETFKQTGGDYVTAGSSGSASSLVPLHNAATTSVLTEGYAIVDSVSDPVVPTVFRTQGGANNVSTSGGTVMSRRAVAAQVTQIRVLNTHGAAATSGTFKLWGRKDPYRLPG